MTTATAGPDTQAPPQPPSTGDRFVAGASPAGTGQVPEAALDA